MNGQRQQSGAKQKSLEVTCPMCGSPLAKSPAGATMMHMMAQMGKQMQGAGRPQAGMPMRRPGMGGR